METVGDGGRGWSAGDLIEKVVLERPRVGQVVLLLVVVWILHSPAGEARQRKKNTRRSETSPTVRQCKMICT